ncbi:unnamed protein product [Blepharisma stoltei]|uniref:TmcB/TmcC TPR repeats domain-containing protein n=1 Tax=Blepharisma stoltei TaxID=1481888 RepID=A0AAU9IVA9_9CILI|nr:unnamed protein product [Blepharisma stoltei]
MSLDFRNDGKESSLYRDFLSQSLYSSHIKTYFYGFFGNLFRIKYDIKTKFNVQLLNEVIINAIMTLQLTSLTWYPYLDIEGWDSYKIFWNRLGIVSYDEVCASLNIMEFCFYGTASLLMICLGSFWIFGIYIYLKKDPPAFLATFPQKIAFFLTSACLIPSTMISLMVFKYSLWPKKHVDEYDGISSGEALNFGVTGGICSIICIVLLVLISVWSEFFTCDIKHSHSKANLRARSSAALDIHRRWFYIFMGFAYIGFGDSNVIIHQIISALWSIYLLVKNIISMQYYNVFENSIIACGLASVSVTLLIFIFGQIMDNAMITVILSIFLQPMVLIFTILLARKNYYSLPCKIENIKNQFDFERKFRHFLIDENRENKNEVLDLFKEYWNMSLFQKNKFFVMWEFYYCLHLKDERLARIKLSKISTVKSSFEADIQEWRIFTWLLNRKYKPFPDINYLHYLKELSRVKKFDEKLCLILVELCSEFSSRSPKIDRLIKLVNKTSNSIKVTTENYKLITEKHKNFESYDLYASFLDNIISNHEEANLVNRKKNGLNQYQKNDDDRLENYGKGVGVILISCAVDSFGSIAYLNEKAAVTLKSSIINISGTSVMNFIPPPYDLIHEKIMKKFIFECTSTLVSSHHDLVFRCTDGFLLECDTLIKLSAFHNSAYFLLSFKPKKTSRHVALISGDGFIISHSISFPCYFSNEKSLKDMHISNIIPYYQNIKKGVPWIFTHNGKEVGLLVKNKAIRWKILNYLLIVHDDEELAKLKLKGDQESMEIINDIQNLYENDISQDLMLKNTDKLKNFPISLISRKKVKLNSILPGTVDNTALVIEENKIEEKMSSEDPSKYSSTFSSFSNAKFSKKLLMESKQKIQILQWVFFILMSSTIVIVVGILAYMISDVTYTTSMSSFYRYGRLLFDLGWMSDSARAIDKNIMLNGAKEQLYTYIYRLGNTSLELEDIQLYLIDDFHKWDYCPYAKIIKEPIMPQWNFEGAHPKIIYKNFYDTVSDFIYAATNLLNDVQNNQTYSDHVKFIVSNGLGYTFTYANFTMNEIVKCEVNRVKHTGNNIEALLMFGFSALGISVLIIAGYIMMVSKKHDEFWNFVLERAQFSLAHLKGSSIDRLFIVHGIDYQSDAGVEAGRSRKKIKSNLHKRYIWRVMIFFAIVASYYLLIYCYLYPNCKENMINRPKLLSNFNIRNSLISRLSVFARETTSPYWSYLLPYSQPSKNPKDSLNETWYELTKKSSELNKKKFLDLMSDELKTKIFEKGSSTLNYLHFGSQSAVFAVKDEIYNILYWQLVATYTLYPFLLKVTEVQNEIRLEFTLADRDSKDVINGQLSVIIYTTVIYSLAVVLLYFLYYLPYLNVQIKQLERFGILPTILSMESE